MRRKTALFLVVISLLPSSFCFGGEWYPVLIHTHTTFSDGGKIAAALATIIRQSLGSLRADGKCAWVNCDHFDGMARDFAGYVKGIEATGIPGQFIAMPCLELGSKWRPEANTVADANILAIGVLPANFTTLVDCYSVSTGDLPLEEKFDNQQRLISEILGLGMLPVAAHPTQMLSGYNVARVDNRFNMQKGYKGLCGVETMNTLGPGQDDECVNWYLYLVSLNLMVFVTAGSDYHGTVASTIPDVLLGSIGRITWVYADEFSAQAILQAIAEGKTYAGNAGACFGNIFADGGQNPGFKVVGVDDPTIIAQPWVAGRDVNIIVYRNGTEVTRQRYKGDESALCCYPLNGGDEFKSGWTDSDMTPGTINRYVIRVVSTTKPGTQTQLITSPITLRLRLPGETASFFDAIRESDLVAMDTAVSVDPSLVNARDPRDIYNFKLSCSKPLALSVACALSSSQVVGWLLDHGADPDCRLGAGEAGPLMEVAKLGDVDKARVLLGHGANVNIRTDGNTPLVWAISNNHPELARFLIDAGADVNLPGDGGIRPLARARTHNMADIEKLLLAKGAN